MNTTTIKSFCLIAVFSFLTILFTFGGCSSGKSTSSGYSPEGTEWILETMNSTSVISLDDNNVTLKFDETLSRISGSGGCNTFFGNYKLDGTALKFSEIGSTKMMCDDMQIETDYFAALKKTDKHEIKNGKLQLLGSSAVLLIFRKK